MKTTRRFALLFLVTALLTLSLASCSDGGNIRDDTESGQIDMVPNHPTTDTPDSDVTDRIPGTTTAAAVPSEKTPAEKNGMNNR